MLASGFASGYATGMDRKQSWSKRGAVEQAFDSFEGDGFPAVGEIWIGTISSRWETPGTGTRGH